jgi:hypothetical protein
MNPKETRKSREHAFTLVLEGVKDLTAAQTDALYEAECDDATIVVREGRVYLEFDREAPSLKDAILSAIRDVQSTGLKVLRVDEVNLVTQSEIARRIKRTRQQVHQYIRGVRGSGNFPAAVSRGKPPLWNWHDVARWLYENKVIGEAKAREANQVSYINTALASAHHQYVDPELVREVTESIGGN